MNNIVITKDKGFDGKTIYVASCRFSGRALAVARPRPFESAAARTARLIASATDPDMIAMRDRLDNAARA